MRVYSFSMEAVELFVEILQRMFWLGDFFELNTTCAAADDDDDD